MSQANDGATLPGACERLRDDANPLLRSWTLR